MQVNPLELLIKSNEGDRSSYEALLQWLNDHSHGQLKKGLSRYTNFPKEAFDDITQEVLLTFHHSHHTFDTGRPLLP